MKKAVLIFSMILTLVVIVLSIIQYNETNNIDFLIVLTLFSMIELFFISSLKPIKS